MKINKYLLILGFGVLFCSFVFAPYHNLKCNQDSTSKVLSQKIPVGKTQLVKTLINISGGELFIGPGNENLAEVKFNYSEDEWNPNVAYTESVSEGRLTVKSNRHNSIQNISKNNTCFIHLNKDITYNLGLELGAGVADVNLANYKIEKALFRLGVGSFTINLANTSVPLLKIEAGIGEATIDLSGEWKNNLHANVTAGIGEIEFIVPENVGVRFKISGFLGDIDATGFHKENKEYTNKAYNSAQKKLEFDVTGAIGSIKVTQK